MKSTFRSTITFTEEKFARTRPSVIFINSDNIEQAAANTIIVFKKELAAYGIPNAKFKVEVKLSSPEEAKEYERNRKAGYTTHRELN
jgi:hypothetical protein